MPTPFSSTLRSLETPFAPARFAVAALVLALLTAWLVWFVRAPITLHAVSLTARVEAERQPHDVASPVGGQVVRIAMVLDQPVAEGDLLLEIDSGQASLLRDAQQALLDASRSTLDALQRQRIAETRQLAELRQGARVGAEEARSWLRRSQAQAREAETRAERARRLAADGVVSQAEATRTAAEAEALRAEAEASARAVDRRRSDDAVAEAEIAALLDQLEAEIAREQGRSAQAEAEIARLDDVLERHRVRSPVAGRIGDLGEVRVGSVIEAGERLATLVPDGSLRIVAEFEPAAAVGRIRTGQSATVRLDGFPWTRFGTLRATTSRVGSEPAAGRIRVELEPHPETAPDLPLHHGLPATVEVAVEQATPAGLVLRIAGRQLPSQARPPRTRHWQPRAERPSSP